MSVGFKTYFWPESTRNQVVTAYKQNLLPAQQNSAFNRKTHAFIYKKLLQTNQNVRNLLLNT